MATSDDPTTVVPERPTETCVWESNDVWDVRDGWESFFALFFDPGGAKNAKKKPEKTCEKFQKKFENFCKKMRFSWSALKAR